MNNKEFTTELSRRLKAAPQACSDRTAALVTEMTNLLGDDNTIAIQGFGTFEVRKRVERVVVNPVTRQRMLIPPKLTLNFKPSAVLKEKFK